MNEIIPPLAAFKANSAKSKRRHGLTDTGIAKLKPRSIRYAHPDPGMLNLYVRVMPSGHKAFVVVARGVDGKQLWVTIGYCDHLTVEAARNKARTIISRIRAGRFEKLTAENARLRARIQAAKAALADASAAGIPAE